MNSTNLFSNDKQNIFILIFIWVGLIFILNPIGDYPLNDDWSYAKPVQSILNGEGIKFTGWMSMTLFSQVVWGALWCKIFGFSFTVLRFSTLFLGGIGIVYSYKLITGFLENKSIVFLLTLLILFNPIYLNLSYTFMTDVPFYTFSVISIFHFIKYIEFENNKNLILGLIFSLIAILTRQLALVIPLAILCIGALNFIKNKKFDYKYFAPFIICIISYFVYQHIAHAYFDARGRYDEMNYKLLNQILESPLSWIVGVFNRGVIGLLYLSLFLSPFLFGIFTKSKDRITWLSVLFGGIFVVFLYAKGYCFPILENIIYNLGLGPATLYDVWFFNDSRSPEIINPTVWMMLTILISILFIFLLFQIASSLISNFKSDQKTYFLVFILLGYFIITCSIYTYDRYYLLPAILLICILSSIVKIEIYKPAFMVLFVVIAWFSVAGTCEYMNWNAARWNSINFLLKEKKVVSANIDGGFEFNGWYNYNDVDHPSGFKNLWVHNVDYIIGFNKLKGTDVIYEQPYFSTIWMKNKTIKVLKKNSDFKDLEEPFF